MENENFTITYQKYRNLVMDMAYSVLRDYHLAQDVCHDVFIKLSSERFELINRPEEMRRYLMTVSYHRAVDCVRKINLSTEIRVGHSTNFVTIEDMEEKISTEMFVEQLFRDLKEKNEDWYQIILRVGFYDEPQEIVARDMGISLQLLRTKYHRAKKWIRNNYKSEYNLLG